MFLDGFMIRFQHETIIHETKFTSVICRYNILCRYLVLPVPRINLIGQVQLTRGFIPYQSTDKTLDLQVTLGPTNYDWFPAMVFSGYQRGQSPAMFLEFSYQGCEIPSASSCYGGSYEQQILRQSSIQL